MNKTKVLFVVPFLSGKGGTETVLKKVLNLNKVSNGNMTFGLFLTSKPSDTSWLEDLDVVSNKYSKNLIINMIRYTKYLIQNDTELVVCLSSKLIFLSSVIRFLFRRKYNIVSWIHFSIFHEKTVKPIMLKFADYHLAISSGIEQQLLKLNIHKENIFKIYNPVSKASNMIVRSKKNNVFIFIGRVEFQKQKNLKRLIDSFSTVKTRDWKLIIYGDGEIEICKDYADKVLKDPGLITWKGWVQNPWKDIIEADFLVLSSDYEGFPMVLLESLSFGVPCISSDCPTGPNDIIRNGENGYLYSLGDKNAFSKIIENVLNKSLLSLNQESIVNSISQFYDNAYYDRFESVLKTLSEKGIQ